MVDIVKKKNQDPVYVYIFVAAVGAAVTIALAITGFIDYFQRKKVFLLLAGLCWLGSCAW